MNDSAPATLRALLEEMIDKGASDLHLSAGEVPKLRVDGKLVFSADGEKLLDYAQRLVRLHDEACASFHQSDLAGELRLGITEDVSAPGMAQILSSFSTSFPHISLISRVAP